MSSMWPSGISTPYTFYPTSANYEATALFKTKWHANVSADCSDVTYVEEVVDGSTTCEVVSILAVV